MWVVIAPCRSFCLLQVVLLLRVSYCSKSLSQFVWSAVRQTSQTYPQRHQSNAGADEPEQDTCAWWDRARMYKVFVPSFQDSDGDGLGDLPGVTEHLDWIHGMGMTGIILSPIFEAPLATTDEWADVKDFQNVDARFGGLRSLSALLDRAHQLGMKVVLELTPNHCSDQHAWFQRALLANATLADRNRFVWKPANASTPNWVSFYGNHTNSSFSVAAGQYYYHAFLPSEPDLNYASTEVRQDMNKTLIYWMDRGVDGFSVIGAEYLFEAVSGATAWADEGPLPPCHAAGTCKDFQLFETMPHSRTQNLPQSHQVIEEWRRTIDSYIGEGSQRVLIGNFLESLGDVNTSAWLGSAENPGFHVVLEPTLQGASSALDSVALMSKYLVKLPAAAIPAWSLGGISSTHLSTSIPDPQGAAAMLAFVGLLPGLAVFTYGDTVLMHDGPVSLAECHDPRCLLNAAGNYTSTDRDGYRTPMQWSSDANGGFSTASASKLYLPVDPSFVFRNAETDFAKAVYKNLSMVISAPEVRSMPGVQRTAQLAVQILSGDIMLAVYSDPSAVKSTEKSFHNDTVILVNLKNESVGLQWRSVEQIVNPGDLEVEWEVRFSLRSSLPAKELVKIEKPFMLQANEVLVVSWWFYGTNGIMDLGHWIWFSLLVAMVTVLLMNCFGVHFYYVRRICRLCRSPSLPCMEADPDWAETLPSIAVVVPCYMPNEKSIIKETLEHILNNLLYECADEPAPSQPMLSEGEAHVTVYCVYNGSNSTTEQVERDLAEWSGQRRGRFNRLVHCHRVTTSHSKAENLNAAFEQIDDPYVVVYDADHHPDPKSLRIAMRTMLSRGAESPVDCVQGSTYIRAGGCWFMRCFIDAEFFVNYFFSFPSMQTIVRTGWFGGSNAVWRTDFLRTQAFRPSMQCEDIDFSVRAMLQSAQMEFVPESRSGELAPATLMAFYRQRRRWSLGWEEVTLKYMRSISVARDIGCVRKFGMLYLLPVRWPLLIFNASILYAGIALNVWFAFYQKIVMPTRFVSWGRPINVVNYIAMGFSFYNMALLAFLILFFEPWFWRKLKGLAFVFSFLYLGPFYLLWQGCLIIVSHRILCKGIRLSWIPTARGTGGEVAASGDSPSAQTREVTGGQSPFGDQSPSNFTTVTSIMCSFVPRDEDPQSHVPQSPSNGHLQTGVSGTSMPPL